MQETEGKGQEKYTIAIDYLRTSIQAQIVTSSYFEILVAEVKFPLFTLFFGKKNKKENKH